MSYRTITLIRHAQVRAEFKTICYGQKDIELSEDGLSASILMASRMSVELPASLVFHSGLTRTQSLAEALKAASPNLIKIAVDHRLRERDYGRWEGESWDKIFASNSEEFHDLIEKPESYRPPGGETTFELQKRVVAWFEECLALDSIDSIIAVSHSGPIAALAGYLNEAHPRDWGPWMCGYLDQLTIEIDGPSIKTSMARFTEGQ
jgi:broad specificity phosphatase PhoE